MTNTTATSRGRQQGWRKPPPRGRPDSSGNVYDIERWNLEGDTSATWLYGEWAAGRGPRRVRAGGKVKILESPREYFERVAEQQHLPAEDPTTASNSAG